MSYLSEFHPEIFLVTPRCGGVANIISPDDLKSGTGIGSPLERKGSKTTLKSSRSARSTATGKSLLESPLFSPSPSTPISREFRVKTAAISSPWVLFADEEEADSTEPPNPIHYTMMLCSITISTIMLMAAGYGDIPKEHLKWTLSYLENVKDEYGNYPPNIRGIINHIATIDDGIMSYNENGPPPAAEAPAPEEPPAE